MIDLTKCSPAPWNGIDKTDSPQLLYELVVPEGKSLVLMSQDDFRLAIALRNATDIQMRRGWGVERCPDGKWRVTVLCSDFASQLLFIYARDSGFPAPFEALEAAERWWVENETPNEEGGKT